MERSHFDYIIIGNGLAGLQLALSLSSETRFDQKTIALIDPADKSVNDKTWSFWETKPSKWNALVHKSWKEASIITHNKSTQLNLNPYTYKTIRAIDFYTEAKAQLNQKDNIQFILESVNAVIEKNQVTVTINKNSYTASHVFDSRIPEAFPLKC